MFLNILLLVLYGLGIPFVLLVAIVISIILASMFVRLTFPLFFLINKDQ